MIFDVFSKFFLNDDGVGSVDLVQGKICIEVLDLELLALGEGFEIRDGDEGSGEVHLRQAAGNEETGRHGFGGVGVSEDGDGPGFDVAAIPGFELECVRSLGHDIDSKSLALAGHGGGDQFRDALALLAVILAAVDVLPLKFMNGIISGLQIAVNINADAGQVTAVLHGDAVSHLAVEAATVAGDGQFVGGRAIVAAVGLGAVRAIKHDDGNVVFKRAAHLNGGQALQPDVGGDDDQESLGSENGVFDDVEAAFAVGVKEDAFLLNSAVDHHAANQARLCSGSFSMMADEEVVFASLAGDKPSARNRVI